MAVPSPLTLACFAAVFNLQATHDDTRLTFLLFGGRRRSLGLAVTAPIPGVKHVSSIFHVHAVGVDRLYFSSLSSSMVCTVFLGEQKTEEYRPRRPESYSLLVLLPRAFTGTTTSLMKIL